jgi:hypothetical protein
MGVMVKRVTKWGAEGREVKINYRCCQNGTPDFRNYASHRGLGRLPRRNCSVICRRPFYAGLTKPHRRIGEKIHWPGYQTYPIASVRKLGKLDKNNSRFRFSRGCKIGWSNGICTSRFAARDAKFNITTEFADETDTWKIGWQPNGSGRAETVRSRGNQSNFFITTNIKSQRFRDRIKKLFIFSRHTNNCNYTLPPLTPPFLSLQPSSIHFSLNSMNVHSQPILNISPYFAQEQAT